MSYEGRIPEQVKRLDEIHRLLYLIDQHMTLWHQCCHCDFESLHWVAMGQHIIKEHPEVLEHELE